MVRLNAQAVVEAVPQSWFEEYVRALLDRLEALSVDTDGWLTGDDDLSDIALVEGKHLTPGARYQRHTDPPEGETGKGTTTEYVLTSWRRTSEIAANITTWDPDDDRTTTTIKLTEPDALRSVLASGKRHARKRMERFSWAAQADLEQWWRRVDRKPAGGASPVTFLFRHAYVQASLHVRPTVSAGWKWRLNITARVRGRGLFRPFAAMFLLFARGRMEKAFRETVDEIAKDWNEEIPKLIVLDPREAPVWWPEFRRDREELDRWLKETGQES